MVIGDLESVLRLGPATLVNKDDWEQKHSDTLAHFVQVHRQIAESSWYHSGCRFTMSGGHVTGSNFSDLEAFVYAAVYFRQLLSEKDRLFFDACETYGRFVGNPVKAAWVDAEREGLVAAWSGACFFVPDHSAQTVFDAFLYGSFLLHHIPKARKKHVDAFKAVISGVPRERLLYGLNGSLLAVFNYVAHVAAVVSQDFSSWSNAGLVPAPDLTWHKSLFRVATEGTPG